MTTDAEYAVMVSKGAALLDERVPGWPARVGPNPDTFSPHDCVSVRATQTGDWWDSMEFLGIETATEYSEHGFRAMSADMEGSVGRARDPYDVLNRLWRTEIAKRLPAVE